MTVENWDDGVSHWDTPDVYWDRGDRIPFVQLVPGDISIVWNIGAGHGDWVQVGTQLQCGDDLQTAILISLFTDRVATDSDIIPDGTNDPRGWVGDLDADYPIGSRLWLLDREKQTANVLKKAKGYCAEALQWLIDDGVAAKFDITAEWTMPSMLGIHIVVHRTDGTTVSMNFASYWNGIS